MDNIGSLPIQPARDSLESDPAYDYADDAPVVTPRRPKRRSFSKRPTCVPLDEEDFLGDEKPWCPGTVKNSLSLRKMNDAQRFECQPG